MRSKRSCHRASQLATDSRKRIEQAKLTETKVELDVLAEYAPPVAEPLKQASTYERAFHGLKTLSENSLSTVSEGVSAVPGVFGRMKEGVSSSFDRAAAVPSLATNLHKTLSAAVSDTVTRPIEMRLQAGTKALKYGAGAGVGLGVATAILFPPLLPISAGGAVLAAMQGWRSQMDAARKLNEAEREQRIAELRAERSAALSKLTNGAACFQLETDEVNLTVDVEAGETDAVILKGEHSGRSWSQLSVAEKAEVVSVISDGADVVLRLLEFGRETL